MTAPDRVLLPEGTRLVHIGPHKTGTTTLQGAFHNARGTASKQGVHYAGPNRQPVHAAQAIAALREGPDPPRLQAWRRLVDEVRGAREPRIVISSEWFADAQPEGIRRVVSDLGAGQVHVVVTLRPLGRMLASQWQQLAQAGWSLPYERWLQAIFRDPAGADGAKFWHRHAHDRLIERWAEVVGPDRVTIVVADDRDRGAVLRAFEALTGLEMGTLVAPDDRGNRSLTAAEIELVRQLHGQLKELALPSIDRLNLVLFHVAGQLKLRWPDASEARIETPAWAMRESAEVAGKAVAAIRAAGVRAIGDLDSLVAIDDTPARAATPIAGAAWAQLAAQASMGVLGASGLARGSSASRSYSGGVPNSDGWPDTLVADSDALGGEWSIASPSGLSTERLTGVLAARVGNGLAWRLRHIGRTRGEARSKPSPSQGARDDSAVRSLAQVLRAEWQSDLEGGLTMRYGAWLEAVFNEPDGRVGARLWRRHGRREPASGAVDPVAPERAPRPDRAARELTSAEAETVRAFNVAFRGAGLGPDLHASVIRGAAAYLRQRAVGPGEAPITTPGWAVERAAEVAGEVDGIAATDEEGSHDGATDPWPQVGARLVVGVLLASGLAPEQAAKGGIEPALPGGLANAGPPPPLAPVEPIELTRTSTPALAAIVLRRVIGGALARLLPSRRSA